MTARVRHAAPFRWHRDGVLFSPPQHRRTGTARAGSGTGRVPARAPPRAPDTRAGGGSAELTRALLRHLLNKVEPHTVIARLLVTHLRDQLTHMFTVVKTPRVRVTVVLTTHAET